MTEEALAVGKTIGPIYYYRVWSMEQEWQQCDAFREDWMLQISYSAKNKWKMVLIFCIHVFLMCCRFPSPLQKT